MCDPGLAKNTTYGVERVNHEADIRGPLLEIGSDTDNGAKKEVLAREHDPR